MTRELIDLERIRRNWDRPNSALRDEPTNRLGGVLPPADPYQVGRALLDRMHREVADQFPEQMAVLRPFFERAENLFARMAKQERNASEEIAEPKDAEPAILLAAFVATLHDLEDLCEAFVGLNR